METNTFSSPRGPVENPAFNKEFLVSAFKQNWYWFIIAAILGLILALGFNKYFPSSYKSTMTLLLVNAPRPTPTSSTADNLEVKERTINIQDEQSIVSAYSLQLKTLQTLDWKTTVYKKLIIGKKDLYKNEPFRILLPDGKNQVPGVPITIRVQTGGNFTAECDYKNHDGDSAIVIRFKKEGSFGKSFDNDWFHFTLNYSGYANAPEEGSEYMLVMNNTAQMAIDYQEQLVVKTSSPESNVLTVELKGPNVERNVDYLNGLSETYLKFNLDQKNLSALNTLQFIRNQIAGVADSLQVSGNLYTDFRTNNGVVDLNQEGSIILQKMEDIARQENLLKLKINYYNELNKRLNSGDQLKSFVAPLTDKPDPELTNLVQRLTQEFSQLESLSVTAQERNPRVIALNKDIELTQQLIKKNISALLAQAQFELNTLTQQKNETNKQLKTIPKTERKYLDIKRGFDINSQLYNFLLQKRAEAGMVLASNSPDAQILDAATPMTTERMGLKPVVNLGIGILFGLLVAAGFFLLRLYMDKKLKDIDAVRRSLHLSVAGEIPHLKSSESLIIENPNSEITESFRNLRANLRFLLKDHKNALIGIHSVSHEEGRSFIAVNAATILALSGRKVLLVDMDNAKRQLETAIGAKPVKDLVSYLTGEASVKEILFESKVKGLSLTKASISNMRMAELLDTPQMIQFINEVRGLFDFVLIDNLPIGIFSDARNMASYADINLFVLRMGFSTTKELTFINKLTDEETIRDMIVVLNDVLLDTGTKNKKGNFFRRAMVMYVPRL
jgi:uncharacterized protein involved in exopolysaccharide biosynthesis/Mrp family chromosome partitioning ATPase